MPKGLWGVVALAAVLHGASGDAYGQFFGRNKVRYEAFDFQVLETPHFDVYYYPPEREAAYQAARLAERWYARLSHLLDHEFDTRQPLILYASHSHFTQTNIVRRVGESTGGLTDGLRRRIVMPFAPGMAVTERILGHELVHAFHFDIADRYGLGAQVPLWFAEGMAEYLSRGPVDPETDMWMRDAVRRDRLPAIRELDDPEYFPYRYGHALWSYLAGRFGDGMLGRVLKTGPSRNSARRLADVTGVDVDTLSRDWHAALRERYGPPAPPRPADERESTPVITRARAGRVNIAPALAPDGRRLVFLSERDRVSIDVFLADAGSGRILDKIVQTATDPHLDSLQFVNSAGAWDPEGRRFLYATVREGRPALNIVDLRRRATERLITVDGIDQVFNPTWSPDGRSIAFTALQGGVSDLYVVDLETRQLRRLTDDLFTDLHPAWSPDGRRLAFATDRFSSSTETLDFGPTELAALDLASGEVTRLPGLVGARHINPQWSPSGKSLFFIGDAGGVTRVYRLDLGSERIYCVTEATSGVSGISPISPALSVARAAPVLAFSVFRGGHYEIHTLDASADTAVPLDEIRGPRGEPTVAAESAAPSVAALLDDSSFGLIPEETFPTRPYQGQLAFDGVTQPYVAGGGGAFGSFFRAGAAFTFSDLLGDQQLATAVQIGGDWADLGAHVSYLNRRSRWNWGGVIEQTPFSLGSTRLSLVPRAEGHAISQTRERRRQIHRRASGLAIYPLNRSHRLELSGGLHHISFDREIRTRLFEDGREIAETKETVPAGAPVTLLEAGAALVYDTTVHGPLSPILGRRYRFEVRPAMGGLAYTTVVADLRQYVMPRRPFTLAFRARHVGRYGGGAADPRLTPLVLGLRQWVRGYNLRDFARRECRDADVDDCSIIDEMTGSRAFVANVELRFPLLGALSGDLEYGRFVPVEGFVFGDAGLLWTRNARAGGDSFDRDWLRSIGAGVRFSVAGMMLFEVAALRPFDRPAEGWTVGLNFRRGF